eukprot:CFRG1713T1
MNFAKIVPQTKMLKMVESIADSCDSSSLDIGRVAVIGRGPYGVALFEALLKRKIDVCLGVRQPLDTSSKESITLIHPDSSITRKLKKNANVNVVSVKEALSTANVVILCIPANAHSAFVKQHVEILRMRATENQEINGVGITLIDISNTPDKNQQTSVAERLNRDLMDQGLGDSLVNVVKAFNTVSAYELGNSSSLKGTSEQAPVCGASEQAKCMAIRIGTMIGLRPFDIGPLSCARDMESLGFSLFSKWGRTMAITLSIIGFFLIYTSVWYVIVDFPMFGQPVYSWMQPSVIIAKTFANTSLSLLAITYLPGKIANIIQLYNRSARKLFPGWLSSWLQIRKQLGLMACWLMLMHVVLVSFMKTGAYGYYSPFNNVDERAFDKNLVMSLFSEIVLLLGVFSATCLIPVMLSSLPSVGMGMSWREWSFVQRIIGHTALMLAGLHSVVFFLTLYGCPPSNNASAISTKCVYIIPRLSSYPAYLPPPSSISGILSLFTCLLWGILSIPFVTRRTEAIRAGRFKKHNRTVPVESVACFPASSACFHPNSMDSELGVTQYQKTVISAMKSGDLPLDKESGHIVV